MNRIRFGQSLTSRLVLPLLALPLALLGGGCGNGGGMSLIAITYPLTQAARYLTAEAVLNSGNITGTADENTNGTLSPDVSLSGTYVIAANGVSTSFTAPGSGNSVLYMVSGTKAYLLDKGTAAPVIEEVVQ